MNEGGNKLAISAYLANFKERSAVKFEKLLDLPMIDRIPEMVKSQNGRDEVFVALVACLNGIVANINLRVGLNEDQIIEIANMIIDQSHEDNLAIEDLLLFGQRLLVGDYGKIYDRLDVPTFFEFFEKYRQKRHEAMLNIREEQHAQFKSMGRGPDITPPVPINREEDPKDILGLMQSLYSPEDDAG